MTYILVAHRGNAAEQPENTLAALDSAYELGARWLEIDVQLCTDRVPVMLHDHDLERTARRRGCVHDLHSTEVIGTDLGGGARLSSLAEVAAWLLDREQAQLFVELKRASIERFGVSTCLAAVLAALGPARARCVYISFDADSVIAARSHGIRVGWVLPAYDAAHAVTATRIAPEFLFVDTKKLPKSGPLWPGPWAWCAYEVTSQETALQLTQRGIQFIESMRVRRMLSNDAP
jgi:glycerophosphoryl diester phosphodiesterase